MDYSLLSLYEIIGQNMKDGILPEDFSLPEEGDGVRFADGAKDGILLYHARPAELTEEGRRQMAKALELAAALKKKEADAAFTELGRLISAVSVIDAFSDYILDHAKELDPQNVFKTALYLIMLSKDREAVKFGLAVVELLQPAGETLKSVIRRIGLSDEFTLFAVWNMQHWDGGNEEIFDLARKVHGWGRIHAVESLEPDTEEIRDWLLHEGIRNAVMPEYSALTVWNKARVAERLKGPLTQSEFESVTRILSALLSEGPVPGISAVANAEEAIADYLAQAVHFSLDEEEQATVRELQNYPGLPR